MLDRFFQFFSSLKLTVVLLGLATLLVFVGTIAQVQEGLYMAQHRYFKSLLIFWSPEGSSLKIPVFPGGYLVGGLLLVNLIAAHIERFVFTRKKAGIFLTHIGVVLLLLGQLLTDALSVESALRFGEGEAKNYSEDFHDNELAIINHCHPFCLDQATMHQFRNGAIHLVKLGYDQATSKTLQIQIVTQGMAAGDHISRTKRPRTVAAASPSLHRVCTRPKRMNVLYRVSLWTVCLLSQRQNFFISMRSRSLIRDFIVM